MRDLIKKDFFEPITSFFDDGFKFITGFPNEYNKILNGKCDFIEEDDKYKVELEVPGVKKDEINIDLKEDILTISWKRVNQKKKEIKGSSNFERREGSFNRSFTVKGANQDKIEAELKEGVLTIILPKLEEFKPKKIEIK